MEIILEREDEELAKNHSDSDDWTLVSPPESANSSLSSTSTPDQEGHNQQAISSQTARNKDSILKKQRKDQTKQSNRVHKDAGEERRQAEAEFEMRASGSQDADDEEDDGLVDIDLNVDDEVKASKSVVPERVGQSNLRLRKSTKGVEFAPVPNHQQQTATRTRDCSTNTQTTLVATPTSTSPPPSSELSVNPIESDPSFVQMGKRSVEQQGASSSRSNLLKTLRECSYSFSILVLIVLVYAKLAEKMIEDKGQKRLFDLLDSFKSANNFSEPFDLFYIPPEDTAYMHLKRLDSELEACIREKGYGWLQQDGKLSHPKRAKDLDGKVSSNSKYKPFRGVVCYERESEWRARFNKLKSEYNVDLRKLAKQGYKRLASNFLKELHSGLRFSLVLNQLDYLDYLDELRRRQELERLKADNLELKKRLTQPNSNTGMRNGGEFVAIHSSKSLAKLENENGKLKREIDALKASLVEKTGTVYIKQSLELEKCERENSALRQFHQQVAHEVLKSLKQMNMLTIDAAALLNDHESLGSQLALTRGYLLRLGDEITKLIANNKNVEKESEFYKVLLATLDTTQRAKQIEHNDDELVAKAQVDDESNSWGNNLEGHPSLKGWPLDRHAIDLATNERLTMAELDEHSSNENKSTGACENAGGEEEYCSPPSLDSSSEEPDFGSQRQQDPPGPRESRGNWLMRRAKLRERLRKSSGIDIPEKKIDRLIDQSKYLYKNHNKAAKQYHHHIRQQDHSHKHHDTFRQDGRAKKLNFKDK